jgi:uncharacterized Fe-S cluster-containing radical SAM superfamily protein
MVKNNEKFSERERTAKGEPRAWVHLDLFRTLWFNTGTLCNITCANCYIESSPTNDRLVYLNCDDVLPYLDELDAAGDGPIEIGFTGGEPFMNPDMIALSDLSLERGHTVLVLTNAMKPMMRPRVQAGLIDLLARFPGKLTLRVSLDHWSAEAHDEERGEGAFEETLRGLDWLASVGCSLALAGRSLWGESEAEARAGFADLIAAHGWNIDAKDAGQVVLFPEMDEHADVPEITPSCWGILGVDPGGLMCASSRMVVKRKGAAKPIVMPCTLLPYQDDFVMGESLADARSDVFLNHRHCAKFCVLGGGSCSA